MSIDNIRKIVIVEEQAEERLRAAGEKARLILAGAESSGKQLYDSEVEKAEAESGQIIAGAVQRAERKTAELSEENDRLLDRIKAAAEQNIGKAADFIVERIVSLQ